MILVGLEKLIDMLSEHSDLTDRLLVEITETVALENIEQTVSFIEQLHDLGSKVAIDDFGAGFTSFRNLKILNVDKVKIDGSFCVDLSNNPENQIFVKTLIELAKNLDLLTVAEWVENQQDADLLTSWGVDYLQGRLHGMAQDGSQWGDPIEDAQEVCVVPSEIFNTEEDNEEDSQESSDASSTDSDDTGAGDNIIDSSNESAVETQETHIPFKFEHSDFSDQEKSAQDSEWQIPDLEIDQDESTLQAQSNTSDDELPDTAQTDDPTQTDVVDIISQSKLDDELSKLRNAIKFLKTDTKNEVETKPHSSIKKEHEGSQNQSQSDPS